MNTTIIKGNDKYEIRKSGKDFFKILKNGQRHGQRYGTVEAAQVAIMVGNRVMTRKEYSIVHRCQMAATPTEPQAKVEALVASGAIVGLI